MARIRAMLVLGTRPEAIKLAPILSEMRRRGDEFEPIVVLTAQHREMLDQVLGIFSIEPDIDLDLMQPNQTLSQLSSLILARIAAVMEKERPDVVLLQGDTTTVLMSALAAFYLGIPVAHIEAGLRSFDLSAPFPEEMNRRVLSQIATLHFSPTQSARRNLLAEGVREDAITVSGNPVVDALLHIKERSDEMRISDEARAAIEDAKDKKLVLLTAHRRESFGGPLGSILRAVKSLALSRPDLIIAYPVHMNPEVRSPVMEELGDVGNIRLMEPQDYPSLVALLAASDLVMTDSGGIQEEAPTFGVPVIVLREKTERPEGVEMGIAHLVGTDEEAIREKALEILSETGLRPREENPYGDGRAAARIAERLKSSLSPAPRADGRREEPLICVVLPSYNEEHGLAPLLERLRDVLGEMGSPYHIIAVNDGSSDETGRIAAAAAERMPMTIITHSLNRGLGETIRDGFERAAGICAPGDIIVRMDADNTQDPEAIPRMVARMKEGFDVVIASRYAPGAAEKGLTFRRWFFSKGANTLMKILFPIRGVRDYSCGYRAYRAGMIQHALSLFGNRLIELKGLGFTCTQEKLLQMRRLGARIAEVPYTLRYDLKADASKMGPYITILGYLILIGKYLFRGRIEESGKG